MKLICLSVITFWLVGVGIAQANSDLLNPGLYTASQNEIPYASEIVNQNSVKGVSSYTKSWYFCGQAAWATVFNVLRSDQSANHVAQLEWFHNQLMTYPSYKNDANKQANGDYLLSITNQRDDFVVSKKTTMSRDTAKVFLHEALISTSKQLPVVLSSKTIGGNVYSHFYVVYKIDYQPTQPGGGIVFYADPYTGKPGSMSYTQFLDGMKSAGTLGRYSIWVITAK